MLPYTIDEIKRRVQPVAEKHRLSAVYIFGSYARGEANAESDIDLLVDTAGADMDTLLKLGSLYNDLENALETAIDLVTVEGLEQPARMRSDRFFKENVKRERKIIYAVA